jgi:acyl-CoA thioesterase
MPMADSGEEFWTSDTAARDLGLQLVSVAPGTAKLTMTVTDRMINGHGICHGGMIFMLADSAFAIACNTRPNRFVGQQCTIVYLKAAKRGDTLVAVAKERSRSARSGIYDVTVTLEDGTVIAEFMGTSRLINKKLS